uniref:Uncharacterized protein n=1 Tax=Nothobranchius furzeri TaxID=105023 RepID=A0A8C6LHB8_NOTFU
VSTVASQHEGCRFETRPRPFCVELRVLPMHAWVSSGYSDNQTPGLLLAPGVRWGQTPINQLTPWDTDEPPAKQHRDSEPTGPTWATSVAAVSQSSLLSHSYALPQLPSFTHSVTAQSPIIGVTPSIQTPVAQQHPLMTTHFQLTPQSTQQPPTMVLSMPSQPPYAAAQPTVTPSALAAQANHVVHPSPHSIMGNGQLTSHSSLLQPPTLPLTNGQAAPGHAPPTSADNQETPNGLQMLRTVGSGKYEFSDPGHPKGKHRLSQIVPPAVDSGFCLLLFCFSESLYILCVSQNQIKAILPG